MKYTDYKFWYIRRTDNVHIDECAIRFYEGEYQTKTIDGVGKEVYVRTKRLQTLGDLKHLEKNGKLKGVTENNQKKCVYYNQEDFGQIETDDELRNFLNKEIAKDKGRKVIKEQKI